MPRVDDRCRCPRRIPTQEGDGDPFCDNCGGSVKPWPGLPGFERSCAVCGEPLRTDRRSDARCCSAACRADLSRQRRLEAGATVDKYDDPDSYEGRRRRKR